MLKGKIIHDGPSVANGRHDYYVKVVPVGTVGSITIDITDDVRTLIARERATHEQAIADLRAKHADTVDRYNQIQRIVLAGGAGMPTG